MIDDVTIMRPLPARLQSSQARVHRKKCAFKIDVEHLIPIGDAHLPQPRGRKDSGVATDDVDAAVALHRRRRHSGAIFGVRNIRGHRARRPSRGTDLGSGCLGLRQVPRDEKNLGPFAGEDARNSLPYAFARAGDDNRAA